MTKNFWLESMAHIYAQSAAVFLFAMGLVVFLVIRHDIKKESYGNVQK